MKTRKIPLRKCTGCIEMKSKKELIRVVASEENGIKIDFSGKMHGRGAYICPSISCLQKAHKTKGLERSLKMPVPKDIYEELIQQMENPDKHMQMLMSKLEEVKEKEISSMDIL